MAESNQQQASIIAALLRERRGCEARGLKDRVREIDKQLRRLGYEAAKPAETAQRRPAAKRAQTR